MKKRIIASVMITVLLIAALATNAFALSITGPQTVSNGETIILRIDGGSVEGVTADITTLGLELVMLSGGLSDASSVLLLEDYGGMVANYTYRVTAQEGQTVSFTLSNVIESQNMIDTPLPTQQWTATVGAPGASQTPAPSSSTAPSTEPSPSQQASSQPSGGQQTQTPASQQPSSSQPGQQTQTPPASQQPGGESQQPGQPSDGQPTQEPTDSTQPTDQGSAQPSDQPQASDSQQPAQSQQPSPTIGAGTPTNGGTPTGGNGGGTTNNGNNQQGGGGGAVTVTVTPGSGTTVVRLPKTADATTNMWLFACLTAGVGTIAIVAAKKCSIGKKEAESKQ